MKVINQTNFTKEISKNLTNENCENFKANIVRPDQILSKLYHFAFPPFTFKHISEPSSFPLEQKKNLFKQITEKDRKYFEEKYFNTPEGPDKKGFRLFKHGFESMSCGIKFISTYPDFKTPLDIIFNHAQWHVVTRFVDNKENKRIRIQIGKYWPVFSVEYWHYFDGDVLTREEYHLDWLLRKPDNKEYEQLNIEWEIHAIEMIEELKGISEYENILLGIDNKVEYRIKHFHRGKHIYTEREKYVTLPMVRKYEPLFNSTIHNAIDKQLIEWPTDVDPRFIKEGFFQPGSKKYESHKSFEKDKEAFRYLLYEEFKKEISDWSKNRKTEIPAQYFKVNLRGFITSLFRRKNHTTTSSSTKHCDPEQIDDWYYCRHKSPKDDLDSPECYHREEYLCKHSEAKRKRIDEVYSEMDSISAGGGVLNERESEDGEKIDEVYHDNLISVETDLELMDIYSHVASDPKDLQILFLMIEFGENNYSEIGKHVGLSDNGVRKRVKKIKKEIKTQFPELLEGHGITDD